MRTKLYHHLDAGGTEIRTEAHWCDFVSRTREHHFVRSRLSARGGLVAGGKHISQRITEVWRDTFTYRGVPFYDTMHVRAHPRAAHLAHLRAFPLSFEMQTEQWNDGSTTLLDVPLITPAIYVHDESDEDMLSNAETESMVVREALLQPAQSDRN